MANKSHKDLLLYFTKGGTAVRISSTFQPYEGRGNIFPRSKASVALITQL